ncbi:hypothetical protein QUB70_01130 [Microcoleus sp. A003_D6]|uniref:hypothetical protein n=1 Tax=Microcoleus sp. A003_D6 TaxID=3055266 RepID=UPI002FD6F78F
MQKVKKWQWGISISYDKKGGNNLKVEHSSQQFFCAERVLVRGYRSDCVGSGIEGQQRVGFDRLKAVDRRSPRKHNTKQLCFLKQPSF